MVFISEARIERECFDLVIRATQVFSAVGPEVTGGEYSGSLDSVMSNRTSSARELSSTESEGGECSTPTPASQMHSKLDSPPFAEECAPIPGTNINSITI